MEDQKVYDFFFNADTKKGESGISLGKKVTTDGGGSTKPKQLLWIAGANPEKEG